MISNPNNTRSSVWVLKIKHNFQTKIHNKKFENYRLSKEVANNYTLQILKRHTANLKAYTCRFYTPNVKSIRFQGFPV